MCSNCSACFSEDEKVNLRNKGWNDKQISFAENSVVEDKIRELIK